MVPFEFKTKDASLSSSPSPSSAKKSRSRVRKKLTILKKAMTTKKSAGQSSKGWQNAFCVETDSCVSRKPKLSGAMDPGKPAK